MTCWHLATFSALWFFFQSVFLAVSFQVKVQNDICELLLFLLTLNALSDQ